ncbi:Hypothetical protein CINCED_3A004068 [Cinara cedri]|uniref:Uncharacterized protein n=1 Tax=Cinara cedri TaxID=506608 RepID=A0A5E4NHT7_9HEMI|nr:Hypothetical protein CINCED_3A004068 [Cinara cedri]
MARDTIVHDVDLPSLEYDDEETAYMATETPSFDPDDATLGCTFVIVEEDNVSDLMASEDDEEDVSPSILDGLTLPTSATNPELRPLNTYEKLSLLSKIKELKKYQMLAKFVKRQKSEAAANGEEPPVIMSPDSGINELQGLSLEEQEKQREEWQQELNKVEEEIKTLREVLGSKVKASQELRHKLGYTVWQEISEDVSQSLRNVKESNVYQNVEEKFTQIGKAVVDAPIFNFSLPDSSDMRTPTRNMVLKHCYQNVESKVKQLGTAVVETPM